MNPLPIFFVLKKGTLMDREERPPSWSTGRLVSILGGQLRLGLMEESKKETLLEDLVSFLGGLISYVFRRVAGLGKKAAFFVFSGFTLTERFKFWLSRRFVRRKGQLTFPFAHVTLVGVSLTLLVATAGLGGFIFQKPQPVSSSAANPFILESQDDLITEESKLLRSEAITYTVVEGDTLSSIAEFYRVPSPILVDANRAILPPPYRLKVGMKLIIPAPSGTVITLDSDTTVSDLAGLYGAVSQDIIEHNYLFPSGDGEYRLKKGMVVIIPIYEGGFVGSAAAPTGECGDLSFAVWPAASRNIFESFLEHANSLGFTYAGVDISASLGEDLYAASDGKVVRTGTPSAWNNGYGGSVFINVEGTGYQIRYAHLSQVSVTPGQKVSAGDVVGKAGSTGWAYGPHLHFELLCNDKKIDPAFHLPL